MLPPHTDHLVVLESTVARDTSAIIAPQLAFAKFYKQVARPTYGNRLSSALDLTMTDYASLDATLSSLVAPTPGP